MIKMFRQDGAPLAEDFDFGSFVCFPPFIGLQFAAILIVAAVFGLPAGPERVVGMALRVVVLGRRHSALQ